MSGQESLGWPGAAVIEIVIGTRGWPQGSPPMLGSDYPFRRGRTPMADARPAQVTVVTARGCHFCEDARQALADLGRLCPLTVDEISAASPVGQALVLEHAHSGQPR